MIFNVTNETLNKETVDFMNNAICKMPKYMLKIFLDEILFNLHSSDELLQEQLMWTANRVKSEIEHREKKYA